MVWTVWSVSTLHWQHGISTSQPRRRRSASPRNIHVAAAAESRPGPSDAAALARPTAADDPARHRGVAAARLHGISASRPRRRGSSPRNIHVAAAAAPRLVSMPVARLVEASHLHHGTIKLKQARQANAFCTRATFESGATRDEVVEIESDDERRGCRGAARGTRPKTEVVDRGDERRSRLERCSVRGHRGIDARGQVGRESPHLRRALVATERPRRGRGDAAPRLHGTSTWRPRRRRDPSAGDPRGESTPASRLDAQSAGTSLTAGAR